MAFGTKGSVRETWHFINKAVSKNPDIDFENFYNDPLTQKQVKFMKHQLGEAKTKERVWDMFTEIKQSLGYEMTDEEDRECDEEETLKEQVERFERSTARKYGMTCAIIKNNINNPRYLRANSADKLSFKNESVIREEADYNADLVENDVAVMAAALESVFGNVDYVIDWSIRGKLADGISFTVGDDDHIFNDDEVQELIDEIDDQINGEIDFSANDTDLEVEITY